MRYGSEPLSPEYIRSHISDLDIFEYYIDEFEEIGIPFCSELREDNNPSAAIQEFNDIAVYKDFGTGESYDAIAYVQKLYNTAFNKALWIIYQDLIKGEKVPKQAIEKKKKKKNPSVIKVKTRRWNSGIDKEYWGKYYLTTKILNYFNIYPLEFFTFNDSLISRDKPIYAFYFDRGTYKVLRPFSEYKWISNATSNYYQGYQQLPEKGEEVIITSSMKDIMVLYKLGYNAIAPQSETQKLDEELMKELKERFHRVLLLFDNDLTGIRSSKMHYEHYGIPYTFTETYKDPSELIMNQGVKQSKTEIEWKLKNIRK